METTERLRVMTEIVLKAPEIGKTAMMKITYLLQALYDMPLGYDYEIYTYGPYCQAVMNDIEFAEAMNYIEVQPITYESGMRGYKICATKNGEEALKTAPISEEYMPQIDSVLDFFGQMRAKELELYSTIVFVFSSYHRNGWDEQKGNICTTVQNIKPHFSSDTIEAAFDNLLSRGFLS